MPLSKKDLIELHKEGVSVSVSVVITGVGEQDPSQPPAPTDEPADQYVNYRKLAIPVGRVALFAVNKDGLAGAEIGFLRNNDVVDVEKWNHSEGDPWRLVRVADLGDLSERAGEIEAGVRGWMRKSDDWEFAPL